MKKFTLILFFLLFTQVTFADVNPASHSRELKKYVLNNWDRLENLVRNDFKSPVQISIDKKTMKCMGTVAFESGILVGNCMFHVSTDFAQDFLYTLIIREADRPSGIYDRWILVMSSMHSD